MSDGPSVGRPVVHRLATGLGIESRRYETIGW